MIEQSDLNAAVGAGVIDAGTAARLVAFARDHRRGVAGPDEESFRLLTGFNDIFVTIAIGLLLFALGALGGRVAPAIGAALVAAASWGLAEYFTRVRRMALPSIALLLAFVGGVFWTTVRVFAIYNQAGAVRALQFATVGTGDTGGAPGMIGFAVAAAAAALAAFAHWRRFHVPITVAAGAAAVAGLLLALAVTAGIADGRVLLVIAFVAGIAVFALAMHFDARDRARVTRWSDVAFWLHLLAAPMIVHPLFALTGLTGGAADASAGAAAVVILVYVALAVVALAIDRRALLVSALAYVIYAIQALVAAGGALDLSLALTALVIGSFLVLLSAAWRSIRARVLAVLPGTLTARLPAATV
ncbi:MAG: hypothetical protein JO290_10675 [Sphingomonadaceae bacterium]|nr:hypothetical protein [Sphingomonadaceae bacterium]